MLIGTGQRANPSQFVNNVQGINCDTSPMFVMDYDQDGKDDIVSACGFLHGSIFVGRSQGNGQFAAFPDNNAVLTAQIGGKGFVATEPAPVLIDIDGDGLQDIVTCEDPYTLDVWLRKRPAPGSEQQPFTQGFVTPALQMRAPPQGQGGPHPPRRASKLALCDNPKSTHHTFDVDGDGTPDLLVRGQDGWVILRYALSDTGQPLLSFDPVTFPDVGGDVNGSSGGTYLNRGLQRRRFDRCLARAQGGQASCRLDQRGRWPLLREHVRTPAACLGCRPSASVPARRGLSTTTRMAARICWKIGSSWNQWTSGGELLDHNVNTALLPDSVVSMFAPQDVSELRNRAYGRRGHGGFRPGGRHRR